MQNAIPAFPNAELFDPLGHLTDRGLQALCDGTLDELGRLEAGEHLSFCDFCLARYTALLEKLPGSLQAPMRDLVPQVQALMRRRSFKILTNRYFSAAAAVVLAFVMWQFGLFGSPALIRQEAPAPRPAWSLTEALHSWGDGVSAWLDGFTFELPAFPAQHGLFDRIKE